MVECEPNSYEEIRVICKNFKDKEKMRRASRSAATVLDRLCGLVKPGMSTWEIDEAGGELMATMGIKSDARAIVQGIGFSLPTLVCQLMMRWFMVLG